MAGTAVAQRGVIAALCTDTTNPSQLRLPAPSIPSNSRLEVPVPHASLPTVPLRSCLASTGAAGSSAEGGSGSPGCQEKGCCRAFSGSSQRRRCSSSFSPRVRLNQSLSSSSRCDRRASTWGAEGRGGGGQGEVAVGVRGAVPQSGWVRAGAEGGVYLGGEVLEVGELCEHGAQHLLQHVLGHLAVRQHHPQALLRSRCNLLHAAGQGLGGEGR